MVAALESLLDGVIDYAGLYPPAKLDMAAAVREYLDHLAGDESILVNRFICPTNRLSEFQEAFRAYESDAAFELSVIATGGADIEALKRGIDQDRRAIEDFENALDGQLAVESIELKIPDAPIDKIIRTLNPIADFELYLESPLDDGLHDRLHAIADAEIAGAKARTGGLERSAFPTSKALADFLKECLDLGLPFKLTAGLHHPVRVDDPSTGGVMHGFLNVLVASALAEEHQLSRNEIAAILEERNARKFEFDAEQISYNGNHAGMDAIDSMRTLFVGFGSCSVREPEEDLMKLGLW